MSTAEQNTTDEHPTPPAPAPAASEPAASPRYTKKRRKGAALERGATRASVRVADAVSIGLREWDKRSRKSASKKKDGAFLDAFENATRASSKALREAASAPEDFWKGFDKVWGGRSYKKFWWRL